MRKTKLQLSCILLLCSLSLFAQDVKVFDFFVMPDNNNHSGNEYTYVMSFKMSNPHLAHTANFIVSDGDQILDNQLFYFETNSSGTTLKGQDDTCLFSRSEFKIHFSSPIDYRNTDFVFYVKDDKGDELFSLNK